MQPQTPIGELTASMRAGTPEIGQVSGGSPNFDPSMVPPQATPMPNRSGQVVHSHLAKALARRGMPVPSQLWGHDQSASQPMPTGQVPQASQAPQPEMNIPISETELIIKALNSRLGHHSKQEAALLEAQLAQAQNSEDSDIPQSSQEQIQAASGGFNS